MGRCYFRLDGVFVAGVISACGLNTRLGASLSAKPIRAAGAAICRSADTPRLRVRVSAPLAALGAEVIFDKVLGSRSINKDWHENSKSSEQQVFCVFSRIETAVLIYEN